MALAQFIRILVQRLAAEQVQQTVADNLHRSSRDSTDSANQASETRAGGGSAYGPDPGSKLDGESERELLPCHVGIVVALPLESGHFEDRLAGLISIKGHGFTIRSGSLAGRGIAVAISGHGQKSAARAAEALIAGHRPRWLISAGFAGGLQPEVKRGDLVMANEIVGENGERLSIDLRLTASESTTPTSSHLGRLLTVDRIVRKPDEKRQLHERYGAIAVDMESLAVARACQRERQRFLAIRAITDAADDELPRDVERLLNRPTMARKIGAAAGSFLRRPAAIKDLWKLRESANAAADRLATFLAGVIEQLPR